MKRPTLVPTDQLAAVVRAIYSDADARDWDALAPSDRSRAYAEWVEAPLIGGVLTRYMTPEAARAWIKDGPMKEYARANRGVGRYAEFGRSGGTTATDVVAAALGPGASLVAGTEGVKPLHCIGLDPDGQPAFITWGEARNFRNLVWAALRSAVDDGLDCHVVVTQPPGHVTTTTDAKMHRAVADRCGLHLHYMREVLGTRGGARS